MDRFLIGPRPKTVLSYFLEEPEIQTKNEDDYEPLSPPAPRLAATATAATEVAPRLALNIYCDGSCINNGRRGARAGFGVSIQRDSTEVSAVSELLRADEPQTNQRAELRALSSAVQHALSAAQAGATTVRIYTDSEYAINCLTKWVPTWKRSGWRKQSGEPVLHKDILEPLYDAWTLLRGVGFLNHVAAHTGKSDPISMGNARADSLARAALSSPQRFF
jgi:ribonuclease HI